jgi:hypothetical protein
MVAAAGLTAGAARKGAGAAPTLPTGTGRTPRPTASGMAWRINRPLFMPAPDTTPGARYAR